MKLIRPSGEYIIALAVTLVWIIGLFCVGFIPLPYKIEILVFYLLAGWASVYFTCKPIGFTRKNLPFCILAFFSVALMPLIRLALQTRARTWFVYLLFICGILLWSFEGADIARRVIGGAECNRQSIGAAMDMFCLQRALSMYQVDYNDMVPLSFRELYRDKDSLGPLTLSEAERKCRYLSPVQEPPAQETLLIYERKPEWHFHSLREGQFRAGAIGIDKEGKSKTLVISIPKERYGGELRRTFFWYFINTPFKGPEELTPEEVHRYYGKQKIERERLEEKIRKSKTTKTAGLPLKCPEYGWEISRLLIA